LFERPIPCPQDQQQAISTMLAQQATWACDLTLQAADGSAHLLRTIFVPLPDDDTGQRLHLVIATTPKQWLDWPGLPEHS
jgi:hypothetical protein